MSKIYLASSWRNPFQPQMVETLRDWGHEVYDFRNPKEGNTGFQWSEIDSNWEAWSSIAFVEALGDPIANIGFALDWDAMQWAEACVLLLPCGRSAHLEAGYFKGASKPLYIYLAELRTEPELMYKMAEGVHTDLDDLRIALL